MIQILLIAMLIFSPLIRGGARIWSFGPICIMALLILLVGLFRMFSSGEIRIRRTAIDIPILAGALIYLASAVNSNYIYGSITEIIRLGILAVVFYIAVNFVTEKGVKRALDAILITAAVISVFGILQYYGFLNKSWWENPRFLSATYVNHNHFAGYLELVMPVCLAMALAERDAGKKVFYAYLLFILSSAFLLSMSRGGWISLSIAMLFMSWFVFKKGKALYTYAMSAIFIVIAIVLMLNASDMGFLFKRISSCGELDFSGRLEIWSGTLKLIGRNIFLGTGPGAFIYNFPRYRPAGLNALINYAHNDYLQIFSEAGIFMLGVTLFIIIVAVRKGIRTHKIAATPFKSWVSLGLATGILSMSVHGLSDFNFYIPANAVLFTVFLGFIFSITSSREKKSPEIVLRPGAGLVSFFRAFSAAGIALLIVFISLSVIAALYSGLSDKFILRHDMEKAESSGLLAVKLCPFDYRYHYKLAGIYAQKSGMATEGKAGYLKRSASEYKKALQLNPIDSWLWIGLADVYYSLFQMDPVGGEFMKLADLGYHRALDLDPMNSHYLKKFAAFLLNSGRPELSSRMYAKASAIMSKARTLSRFSALFTDGRKYEQSAGLAFAAQDVKKALVFYRMAEEFSEEKEKAVMGQVRCYMKLASPKNALRKYRKMKPSDKNKSTLFAAMADYCLAMGLTGSAARFSRAAVELDSGNPEGYQAMDKVLKAVSGKRHVEAVRKILEFNRTGFSVTGAESGMFEIRFDAKENMARDVRISWDIVLPAGIYEMRVIAKGKEADGKWPHMIVKLNGIEAMNTYVNSPDWIRYPGIAVIDYPFNRVDIIYDNDYYNPETKEDRNLYTEGITFESLY